MKYLILFVLLVLSALFAGLTLGLMSLDLYDLKRKMELGDEDAKKVYKIRKKGNLLLSTLILGNIAVTSTISIILESIAGGLMAGIIATGGIFIFGEVLPQAFFSRYAIELGSITAPFTKLLIIILYPICGPVAYVLDKMLGKELPTIYSKNELTKIVAEHEDHPDSSIDADEERIIHGALQFSDKKVRDIMTPISVVVAMNENDVMDDELLQKIKTSGRSRFPVMGKAEKITGILYAKDLLGVSFNETKKVKDVMRKVALFTKETDKLDNVLNRFLGTRKHLFLVEDQRKIIKGIVTIEDVIEEILKREIVDESDRYVDMRQHAKVTEDLKKAKRKNTRTSTKQTNTSKNRPLQDF
jgi:metal transporter CNNM